MLKKKKIIIMKIMKRKERKNITIKMGKMRNTMMRKDEKVENGIFKLMFFNLIIWKFCLFIAILLYIFLTNLLII